MATPSHAVPRPRPCETFCTSTLVVGLHKALDEAQDTQAIKDQFEKEGAATRKMSSEDFGKFIVSEMNKWERVVKESGIKAE